MLISFKFWLFKLEEASIGSTFEDNDPIFKIKFADVKFDPIEKYYVDLQKSLHNIQDINQVDIGDEIEDYVMSSAKYWKVTGIDKEKQKLYLDPTGKNPFKPNKQGQIVGAGGKIFNQHDFDVQSGKFEQERIDQVLDIINKRSYHDINDISYILLGTIPVQVGPNGSQGGWYNSIDKNNRGKSKGLETNEVIMRDAQSLKKLGLDVPSTALDGSIKPNVWNNFVQGNADHQEMETHLDSENFQEPMAMSKIVLSHKQPQIRKRSADALLRLAGTSEKIDKLIKQTAFDLAKQTIKSDDFDVLWHVKEMFILTAQRNNWTEVLEAFHESHDQTNRKYVANALKEIGNQLPLLLKMLQKESNPESLIGILSGIYSHVNKDYEEKNKYGFSKFSFNQFIEENPEKARQIRIELYELYPLIQSKVQEMQKNLKKSDTFAYYLKEVEIYFDRFRVMKTLLEGF